MAAVTQQQAPTTYLGAAAAAAPAGGAGGVVARALGLAPEARSPPGRIWYRSIHSPRLMASSPSRAVRDRLATRRPLDLPTAQRQTATSAGPQTAKSRRMNQGRNGHQQHKAAMQLHQPLFDINSKATAYDSSGLLLSKPSCQHRDFGTCKQCLLVYCV